MNIKRWGWISFVMFGFLSFLSVGCQALDIALSGETSGGSGSGGGRIGVVDMQKIYQISPQTVNAKDDYLRKLEDKKKFLDQKEKELEMLKARIAILDTTAKSDLNGQPPEELANIQASTEPRKSMGDLKADLEAKQIEFQDAKKHAVEDLAAFEKNQNQAIFGNIYNALKDLAQEEQVTIIVDKASVLFGAAEVDLTEKLQNRIRGF